MWPRKRKARKREQLAILSPDSEHMDGCLISF